METLNSRHLPPPIESPRPWAIGEHVAVIGTTGTGKTYLVSKLVQLRRYVVILRTKPDDIKFPGFKRAETAKALDDARNDKLLIVPEYKNQARVAYELFEKVWQQKNWTIVIDEAFYVQQRLGMQKPLEMLLTQGRSMRISVVIGVQRPVHVTRFAVSEASHVFAFRLEGADQKRLVELTSPRVVPILDNLPRYNFLHWHVPTASARKGEANALDKVLRLTERTA